MFVSERPWWRQVWGVPAWMERGLRGEEQPLSRWRVVAFRVYFLVVLPILVLVVVVPMDIGLWPILPGLFTQVWMLASMPKQQRRQLLGRRERVSI